MSTIVAWLNSKQPWHENILLPGEATHCLAMPVKTFHLLRPIAETKQTKIIFLKVIANALNLG